MEVWKHLPRAEARSCAEASRTGAGVLAASVKCGGTSGAGSLCDAYASCPQLARAWRWRQWSLCVELCTCVGVCLLLNLLWNKQVCDPGMFSQLLITVLFHTCCWLSVFVLVPDEGRLLAAMFPEIVATSTSAVPSIQGPDSMCATCVYVHSSISTPQAPTIAHLQVWWCGDAAICCEALACLMLLGADVWRACKHTIVLHEGFSCALRVAACGRDINHPPTWTTCASLLCL